MARPKLGESDTERLHMKITTDELRAIEDWRYENRVPSKSEAVRRLVQIGLRSLEMYNLMADAAVAASDAVQALEDDWFKIMDWGEAPTSEDITFCAKKFAMTFSEQFPDVVDRVHDTHDLTMDLGIELKAVGESNSVPDGIKAAEKVRHEAAERRKRWALEDALRKQLRYDAKKPESDQ